jgi:hypothetical protein
MLGPRFLRTLTAQRIAARVPAPPHGSHRTSARGPGHLAGGILVSWLTLATACDEAEPQDAPPTFTELHERVLQPSCVFATCHQKGASAAGMMPLDRDVAHASLVDAAAVGAPGRIRVIPGDPEQSYVIEKITSPTPTAGEQMPPDAPLEAERVELIRAWIEAGAADD